MVTDTFFDLQRFADDVLVGSASGFTWEKGHAFKGGNTASDPAYMVSGGISGALPSLTGTVAYIGGTSAGYSFAVKEDKDNWEIAEIKGTDNVVIGNYNSTDGAYGLYGDVDVKVFQGKEFNETVNGAETYVKAKTADTTFNINSHEGSDAFIYTFSNGEANVAIGLDDDDIAYFEGQGLNISFRAGAGSDATELAPITFEKTVSVVSDGAEVVSIYSGDNTFIAGGQRLIATAASSATPVVLTTKNELTGVSEAFADGETTLSVNGNAWSVTGAGVSGVRFGGTNGKAAHVDIAETGVVNVTSSEDAVVGFDSLTTDGFTANGAAIKAVNETTKSVAVQLDSVGAGIKGIALDKEDGLVSVADSSFEVISAGNSYTVSTNASQVTFLDTGVDAAAVILDNNRAYSVEGGDGIYAFGNSIRAGATGVASINSAEVSITNNQDSIAAPAITSDQDKEGVDQISGVKANDIVNVENDGDGYTVIYDAAEGTEGDVVLAANDAVVSLDASYMTDNAVSIAADSLGTEATVTGIEANAKMTLSGGASGVTYQFEKGDEVDVAAGDAMVVQLDSKKNVADVYSYDLEQKLSKVGEKWYDVSTIGGSSDEDATHRGVAQETFYDVRGISSTLLGFAFDDDPLPYENESSVINIAGNTSLGSAAHVTMSVGSGDFAGAVPVNIQSNENDNVVDVTVDMRNAKYPSTVAVGTSGYVPASHKIYLSNNSNSTNPSYAYLGEGATGQNAVVAGGAAMIRHDGENRTSVIGGNGNDTLMPSANDVVYGNGGADLFDDAESYTIQDYSAADGDAIIATRANSFEDIAYGNISGTGNQVQFGTGKTLTLANQSQNQAVYIKAAVLDDDGNVSSARRDVVLANSGLVVDASAASLNGALVIADSTRGNHANYITGSAGNDEIYAGANDSVDGSGGADNIYINDGGTGVVIGLSNDGGDDTVSGWQFGFDRNAGNTQLYLGGAKFEATTIEKALVVTTEDGSSMTIQDTDDRAWYTLLVDEKKYMVIRSGETATVTSDLYLADTYFAEAEGGLIFTPDVVEDLGLMVVGDGEDYENIRYFGLFNSGSASLVGSDARETVAIAGDVAIDSSKAISLAGGNDVIISNGDTGRSNVFFFSTGDGRDSIANFGHYLGVDADPDKQKADVLVIDGFTGLQVAHYSDGDRIVFNTSENDDVVIYEQNGLDINDKMYLVKVDGADVGVAKIGYTESLTSGVTGNVFTYSKEVNYFIGSDVAPRDTLVVGDDVENVEIWLDGTASEDYQFYRGIGVIDASTATATEMTLVGSMDDNTIIGGGVGSSDILWGGAGDNLLVGGAGEDIFLYCKDSRDYIDGAGALEEANHDVITNYDAANDTIYLGDITLDDIDLDAMAASSDGGITDTTVTVQFKNGGTLTVAGTQEETKFNLADGTTCTATRSTNSWS